MRVTVKLLVAFLVMIFYWFLLFAFHAELTKPVSAQVSARLVGGNGNPRAGRLEVIHYGFWGTVCDHDFDNNDAKVACHMLGFTGSGVNLGNLYGGGRPTELIWLENLQCSGSEMSFDNCTHRGWGVHNCRHGEDVSILCSDGIRSVQLVGGNGNPRLGRLEINYGGVWGTVCSHSFDNKDAKVACYMLGFGRSGAHISNQYGGGGTGQIWLEDLQCSGSELSFDNCTHRGWGVHNCGHGEDVAIICGDESDLVQATTPTLINYNIYSTSPELDRGVTSAAFKPIIVRPLYGPVAGGTRVTIAGQSVSVTTVTAVYFGKYKLYPDTDSTAENTVYVTTQPVNETARGLPITLILNNNSSIDTSRTFEYRSNPVFTDIRPRKHLIVGGTEVTVHGHNLDSVAEPRITVTVTVTNFYSNINTTTATTNSNSEPCNVPPRNANSSKLLCRMPVLSLSDSFTEQLEQNESETIGNTEGPGVAVYWASDRSARADVYIGLKLDGVERYKNISSLDHSIKMQFTQRPIVFCKSDVAEFDPHKNKLVSIKGRHMQRGSRLVDFSITLGDAVCVPESLTDNQVNCRPPTDRPNRNINDTFCQGDMLSLQIMIGNAEYQCSCVHYMLQDNIALIVGLSLGLGLLLVVTIIVVVIVVLYRRRHSKQVGEQKSEYEDNIPMERQVKEYKLPTSHLSDNDDGVSQGMSGYVNLSTDEHYTTYVSGSKDNMPTDQDNEDEQYTTHLSDDDVGEHYATHVSDDDVGDTSL